MLNCREPYSGRGRVSTNVGSSKRPKYRRVHVDGDCDYLEKVSDLNQQDLIQSYKNECDVALLVKRYEQGDTAVLSRLQGVYMDTSNLPTDPTDAFNIVRKAHDIFDNLSDDVKVKFDGSFEKFVSTFGIVVSDTPAVDTPAVETPAKEGDVNG